MKKYIIKIAFILSITAVCLQCSDDDNKTTEKSSEQTTQKKQGSEQSTAPTKQELLAKIHGVSDKHTEVMSGEGMEPTTTECGKSSFYLDEEGYLIYYFFDSQNTIDMWIKIKPDEVKQQDNEISVTSNTTESIFWPQGKEWKDAFKDDNGYNVSNVILTYSTETDRYKLKYKVEDIVDMERVGVLSEGEPVKWRVPPTTTEASSLNRESGYQSAVSSVARSGILSNALSLSGVKPVHVRLNPNRGVAIFASRLFNPEGDHYVKFTSLGSDNYKVEFCDASGKVLIAERKGGTGFHGGRMPMKLYFVDVRVHYARNRFSDAGNGNNYVRAFPCDDCDHARIPAFLLRIIDPEGMESRHAEVLNTQSKGDKFYIAVKLNLPVDFTAQITER